MGSITIPAEFNINNLSYGDMKRMDNGGKMVYIGYNKQPLILQTCECYAPFGLQCYQSDDGKSQSYSIELSFKDMQSRKSLQKLYEVFSQIDSSNIDKGFDNAMTWLSQKKQPKNKDVIEALYTPIIKQAKEEKYPSTFKIKLPFKNDNFMCDVFDKNHDVLDIKSLDPALTKGSKCTALIQCTGMWLAGSKFGVSWKCVQLKCCISEKFNGFCMRHLPEDSILGEDIEKDEEAPVVIEKKQEDNDDDDDDDDDDDEDDEDDDEEPVQVVTKKKTK